MELAVNYAQPLFKGSIIKEYLLVVNPATDVCQRVMNEKAAFLQDYHDAAAIGSHPHITIAHFLAKEEMEPTMLRWMHNITSSKKSFAMALNNYSGSPDAHSIYLRVQDNQPFKQLAKELNPIGELVKSNGLPKAQLISNPHLVIAGRLEKPVYDKAMMEYSKKEFHAAFEVTELVLLKRTHQFDSCKQVNVFRLLP